MRRFRGACAATAGTNSNDEHYDKLDLLLNQIVLLKSMSGQLLTQFPGIRRAEDCRQQVDSLVADIQKRAEVLKTKMQSKEDTKPAVANLQSKLKKALGKNVANIEIATLPGKIVLPRKGNLPSDVQGTEATAHTAYVKLSNLQASGGYTHPHYYIMVASPYWKASASLPEMLISVSSEFKVPKRVKWFSTASKDELYSEVSHLLRDYGNVGKARETDSRGQVHVLSRIQKLLASEFDEKEHPRGQPENKGEFVKKTGARSSGTKATPKISSDTKQTRKELFSTLPNKQAVDEFKHAMGWTQGVKIDKDGIHLKVIRYQKPEQAGQKSVRTGVFFMPGEDALYDGSDDSSYGGTQRIAGEKVLKKPCIVHADTGGSAPVRAYTVVKGQEKWALLWKAINDLKKQPKAKIVDYVRGILKDFGGDPEMTDYIFEHSPEGNQLKFAVQEHLIAHELRREGFDSILAYESEGLTELFDLTMENYPTPEAASIEWPNKEWTRWVFQRGKK